MLYISRKAGVNKFGVVDTDDGLEEILSTQEIMDAVCDYGIDIKGVSTEIKAHKNGRKTYLVGINVYQNADSLKVSQTKMKLLYGVDIKTHGDQIVGIRIKDLSTLKPTTIRLSDYGTSCADYLFNEVGGYRYDCLSNLTLILDDKIQVSGKSFKLAALLGVCVDLREVTNERTAQCVYKEIVNQKYVDVKALRYVVKDNPERLSYWCGVCILNKGLKTGRSVAAMADLIPDPVALTDKLRKKFGAEFASISNCKFVIKPGSMTGATVAYMRQIGGQGAIYSDFLSRRDWEYLKSHCMTRLFAILSNETTCNRSVLGRFRNYVEYFMEFDQSDSVKEDFVKFCLRANHFFVEFGLQKGWLS